MGTTKFVGLLMESLFGKGCEEVFGLEIARKEGGCRRKEYQELTSSPKPVLLLSAEIVIINGREEG